MSILGNKLPIQDLYQLHFFFILIKPRKEFQEKRQNNHLNIILWNRSKAASSKRLIKTLVWLQNIWNWRVYLWVFEWQFFHVIFRKNHILRGKAIISSELRRMIVQCVEQCSFGFRHSKPEISMSGLGYIIIFECANVNFYMFFSARISF